MNDNTTTINDLKKRIDNFSLARNWHKNENVKNISMALSVEVAELVEIFQWVHSDDVDNIVNDSERFTHLKEEIADVFWYLTRICNHYDIDLTEAVCDKEIKNAKKYPPKND